MKQDPLKYQKGDSHVLVVNLSYKELQMGWGVLYEVDDSARSLLVGRDTKSDWYDALDNMHIEDLPQLDAEDSLAVWGAALDSQSPLGRLFAGELRTAYDNYDDPNVAFSGREIVTNAALALKELSHEYFVDLLRSKDPGWTNDAWFYEPLRDFVCAAHDRGKGVIIVWES